MLLSIQYQGHVQNICGLIKFIRMFHETKTVAGVTDTPNTAGRSKSNSSKTSWSVCVVIHVTEHLSQIQKGLL